MSPRRFSTPAFVPPRRRGRPGKSGSEPGNGSSAGYHTQMAANMDTESIAVTPLAPRLLNLHSTASYLGLSQWTVRDLEAGGVLQRVRLPLPNHGELRKLLFDRADLDRLIESWKE